MDWKTIVRMLNNLVMGFANIVLRINMNDDISEMLQVMQQLMTDLFRDLVSLCHRKMVLNSNIEFSIKPMPDPSRACFTHIFDSLHMTGAMNDLFGDLGFETVKHPREHHL